MSPDRFIPRKIAEFGHADLREVKDLLGKISSVDNADRMVEALDALKDNINRPDDPMMDEVKRENLRMKILAYGYWWVNCVVEGGKSDSKA